MCILNYYYQSHSDAVVLRNVHYNSRLQLAFTYFVADSCFNALVIKALIVVDLLLVPNSGSGQLFLEQQQGIYLQRIDCSLATQYRGVL